jgi:hypothetical protein
MATSAADIALLVPRAGFGASPQPIAQLAARDLPAATEAVLDTSGTTPDVVAGVAAPNRILNDPVHGPDSAP